MINGYEIAAPAEYGSIVYIDPGVETPGDGSYESPLKSWTGVSFADDTAYLQKRGTTDTIGSTLNINGDGVLAGAYGDEALGRPIILSTDDYHAVDCHGEYITVRDIEITSSTAASGLRFATWAGADYGTVYNCYIHGVDSENYIVWGVRIMGFASNVQQQCRVLYSTIEYTGDDGMFIQNSNNVEIGYCDISHVNQDWFIDESESYSGGDGVQFDSDITGFHVHHCTIDRTDTGNKFCIIANPSVADTAGIVENNRLLICKGRYALFFGSGDNYQPIVRNNYIEYTTGEEGGGGIYIHAAQPKIYNNVIVGGGRGIALISPIEQAQVHHNLFIGSQYDAIWGYHPLVATNNVFDLDENVPAITNSSDNVEASNNMFVTESKVWGGNAVIGTPVYIDSGNENYRPAETSPVIDAGVEIGLTTTDADGAAHVGAPDLGPYEYIPPRNAAMTEWLILP